MYKSKFNYIFKINDEQWCFFNTLKGSLAILSNYEKEIYDDFLHDDMTQTPNFIYDLRDLGFIHNDDFDETSIVNYSRIKRIYTEDSAYIRILTTTGCNARCDYCYENITESSTMNDTTALNTAMFIEKKYSAKKLHLHWFGGEPLLNTNAIDIISDYIKKHMPNTDINVSMTSNGSLINENIVEKMIKRWNISYIQITIDDTYERYNSIKKYSNSKINYSTIINNIRKVLVNGIKVNVRVNYYPSDISAIKRVCRELITSFETYYINKDLIITPSPIFGDFEAECKNMPIDDKSQYSMFDALKCVFDCCNETNGDIFSLNCKGGRCYACHNNSFVISPKGELYKCTMAMNSKGTSVGSVTDGISYNREYYKWVNDYLNERCLTCVCLPLCQGGCRAYDMGYINHSCNYKAVHLEEIIRFKLLHNLAFDDNYAYCYTNYINSI